ncbi:recombinase family protein [Omnitrophica bacterium]|nr:recombinase family protein [Candidatus Omnitrophota bacterium]
MRVAIYARYSSENQSDKSIEDQIRVCKNYIKEHDMSIEDKYIYIDEAISGSVINRPGLQALEKAAENKEFEAVAVDDLSRLSRSNHQMLTLVLKFNYYQVKIISVSDGIISDDENSKLGIQIRGLINELYLDDLKKKTMRGLEGQKLRGFSAGENVYGYYTQPHGELKLNKKGQSKYDGMVHKINPDEADVIRRIFREFTDGKSIHNIAKKLNEDKVPTKKGKNGGWNTSTVSRLLKNQRYVGIWDWRKYKNVKDPMTGRMKKIVRPEKERVPIYREDLVIINKDIWDKAQKRRGDLQGTWPVSKKKRAYYKQKSYIHTSPTHLFSGLMKCNSCGGAIVLISGKGSGYYGCYNAKRKTCDNALLVSRKRIEQVIIEELRARILTVKNLEYVYKKVEKLTSSGLNEVPEFIKKKRAQHEKLLSEIQNYLNFIKMGNLSKAVSEALNEAEEKGKDLSQDIKSLEFQKENRFKTPPKEWVNHRLERLRETLNKNTVTSAMALKELLGVIRLEAIMDEKAELHKDIDCFVGRDETRPPRNDGGKGVSSPHPYPLPTPGESPKQSKAPPRGWGEGTFKPYYVAHTKIQTLALLDEKHKGSNWLQWRRR